MGSTLGVRCMSVCRSRQGAGTTTAWCSTSPSPAAARASPEGAPLHYFIHSDDDEMRRKRLTLIPAIPQGSWLVRNAVGSERFVMLAQVQPPHPSSPPHSWTAG